MPPVHRHVFVFNPLDNGGESLTLITEFTDNGDRTIFYNQTLSLQSYSNSASFELYGIAMTPQILRKLANELEKEILKAKKKLK